MRMYCGQCGKKVMDNMLFCPFCGSPIVIPDQDEPAKAAEAAKAIEARETLPQESIEETWPETGVSLFGEEGPAADVRPESNKEAEEEFVPLWFDFDAVQREVESQRAEKPAQPAADVESPKSEPMKAVDAAVTEAEPPKPARRVQPKEATRPERRRAPAANIPGGKRASNTYIPLKDLGPNELFMDEKSHEETDEYDRVRRVPRYAETAYEFEEREDGGFIQRHMRGFVGLILFFVLLLVTGIWACTSGGQQTLARFGVAWDAGAYAELGYEAYQQNSDRLAARYYERALARDPDNYEYAHSAMVAYYEADDLDSATAMLKKCVQMDPDNPEPYRELLILYPDAASRPWEVTELIRSGYQRTGSETLKLD